MIKGFSEFSEPRNFSVKWKSLVVRCHLIPESKNKASVEFWDHMIGFLFVLTVHPSFKWKLSAMIETGFLNLEIMIISYLYPQLCNLAFVTRIGDRIIETGS